jgi:CDP-diacylglycerol--glycerol-3-phosphate 3-phosphatidyltransferase
MSLREKIFKISQPRSEKPNLIDKILDKLFLWVFPSSVKPNQLTIFRYISIPVIFITLLLQYYKISLLFFIISAFTDALDGAMARTRKQITSWGKIHDPLADKLLIGLSGLIIITKYLGIEIILIILSLEALTIIAAISLYDSKENHGARLPGKLKMLGQSFGLGLLLMYAVTNMTLFLTTAVVLLYLSILFSVINVIFCTFFAKSL